MHAGVMNPHKEVVENIGVSLNAIRTLRSGVGHVFESLTEGARKQDDNKDTRLLLELQELLNTVNSNLKDVETSINGLTVPGASYTLANTGFLSHEINPERQNLYPELVHSYKWHEKLVNYSQSAFQLIGQNALKRSFYSNKRRPTTSHNVSMAHINKIIGQLNFPNTQIKLYSQFANSAIIHIQIGRTLKAAIILKGFIIEWVTVKGFDESLENIDDHWAESRHEVFRKVQDHAHQAMLHFFSPTLLDVATRSFITWIRSYINLFSEPCTKCKKHLHNNLPPTFRGYRTLEPFHEECNK